MVIPGGIRCMSATIRLNITHVISTSQMGVQVGANNAFDWRLTLPRPNAPTVAWWQEREYF